MCTKIVSEYQGRLIQNVKDNHMWETIYIKHNAYDSVHQNKMQQFITWSDIL